MATLAGQGRAELSLFSQYVFDFGAKPAHVLSRFVPGKNALALALVEQMTELNGEPQLYLWGESGRGKTHILQGACERMSAHGRPAAYLSLADAPHPGVLDGLEQLALVALDDIQAVMQSPAWEESLFDLINRLREQDVPLLLAADAPPNQLAAGLPDLASRLSWGPILHLEALDDVGKREVLLAQARERGMELPDEVIFYMFSHLPRGLPSLLAGLQRLDDASMEQKRRVTLPLAREVFTPT
ncbi:MAG: DnaA regulatory inactivator Hda [Pseudomonadota bacterium]